MSRYDIAYRVFGYVITCGAALLLAYIISTSHAVTQ
jgi:hypothetical protein